MDCLGKICTAVCAHPGQHCMQQWLCGKWLAHQGCHPCSMPSPSSLLSGLTWSQDSAPTAGRLACSTTSGAGLLYAVAWVN